MVVRGRGEKEGESHSEVEEEAKEISTSSEKKVKLLYYD